MVVLFSVVLGASNSFGAEEREFSLDWIAGHWCSDENGIRIEEHWLAPAGTTSLGVNRTSREGRMVAFEFLRIDEMDGRLAYLAQPGGRPATRFNLAEHGEGMIAFENRQHDFPQRIEYRVGDGHLVAEISGPGEDGQPMAISFRFVPCASLSPDDAG